jgi:hypothetical protein
MHWSQGNVINARGEKHSCNKIKITIIQIILVLTGVRLTGVVSALADEALQSLID